MIDELYTYATAALIASVFIIQVASKRFDPFAPVWLFLVGYVHLYVIQAVALREWAVAVRGEEVVAAANLRALWALAWFLAVYYSGIGKAVAARLVRPPAAWSVPAVAGLAPVLFAWGMYCSWSVIRLGLGGEAGEVSAEQFLFLSFPFMMLVAGNLLLVTGRTGPTPRPGFTAAGLAVIGLYVLIWMFNGKRSHSLIGVLTAVCGFYVTRRRRPSWPVLIGTAFAGALVVAVAIGWRNNPNYPRSPSGFVQYVGDFRVHSILKSLNIDEDEDDARPSKYKTYETLEYGGFLLMMSTVPALSDYDYGANYLRCVSTFIPRVVWADKPIFGRDKWIAAWRAGSEMRREEDFAGPAIGILGATQLNGGAAGTLAVMAAVALLLRTAYEYFRLYDGVPWVQAWWTLTYYNAWLMVVTDDPMIWFYYSWGVTCLPSLALLFVVNKFFAAGPAARPSGV